MRMFEVKNKRSWLEYYRYYTKERLGPDSILIKCDDDIVYIDPSRFARFLQKRREHPEFIVMFPSIINNGVCAHYQQREGLLPEEALGRFPYDTTCGKLWGDGKLCGRLHDYFADHHREFVEKSAGLDKVIAHPIGDRLSINFFAILSSDLGIFQQIGGDDEMEMSVKMPKLHKRNNGVDMGFVVSHLAFFKQRTTGLDEDAALARYARVADEVLGVLV